MSNPTPITPAAAVPTMTAAGMSTPGRVRSRSAAHPPTAASNAIHRRYEATMRPAATPLRRPSRAWMTAGQTLPGTYLPTWAAK
jgi:hypothetical protein